jgi:hypothetical protein
MIRSLLPTVLVTAAVAVVGVAVAAPPAVAADDTPWTVPVRPPKCSEDQALSGDVAGCVVYFGKDAAADGWGTPPVPGDVDGWEWNGYTYNGSPALEAWETGEIVTNESPLAGFGPGYFQFNADAQVLFEGFLREISDRGYDVRHATGYTFRCTSGSGGWSCPSGDVGGLSLHAWGLALDMNSDANPIRSYSGVDGASACATPIETDLPRWLVETAEKWGLYWGGYGWSNGCDGPDTERSSVHRDPPHFEFSGTPEMARAIARHNLGDAFAGVCFDLVTPQGRDVERCNTSGRPEANWRIPVELDPPEGASAAMVNVAVTDAASRGHISLEDCAARSGPRETAALTFAEGQTVATMAVVPLSDDGRFCVYSNAEVHRIIDVVAYLAEPTATEPLTDGAGADSAPDSYRFVPTTPTRLSDTRAGGATVPEGGTLQVADDATPRLANIAATESTGRGYLQAGACGTLGTDAGFSNLNYPAATTRSNLAFVRGGDDGTCVFARSRSHVVVDELGRFDPEEGLGWDIGSSGRLLDTRECGDIWCGGRLEAGNVLRVPVETDASAIVVAITATQSTARGYLWAGPCSVLEGRERPPTSNLNHAEGETTTNLAVVGLEDGEMCLFNRSPGHVVIDLQAELSESATIGVRPVDPTRVHDTRP